MTEQNPAVYMESEQHEGTDMRRMLAAIFNYDSSVIQGGDMLVEQNGTPNMSVDVAQGAAAIKGTHDFFQGMYFVENRGTTNLAISAADPADPRIDVIVARVYDTEHADPSSEWILEVVTGTPATSGTQVAPAVPTSAMSLAEVAVAAGVTSIVDANITDTRNKLDVETAGQFLARIEDGVILRALNDSAVDTFEIEVDPTNGVILNQAEGKEMRFSVADSIRMICHAYGTSISVDKDSFFTHDATDGPWTNHMLDMGGVGALGTQGGFALDMIWNGYRKLSPSGTLKVVGVNGSSDMSMISLGPSGFQVKTAESVSDGDAVSTLATRFQVAEDGLVGFAGIATTASAANARLDVATGQLQRSTSARKYKQHISQIPLSDAEKLLGIDGVYYSSAIEGEDESEVHVGLLADDFHDAGLRELVDYNEAGEPEALNYERIVAPLLELVKDLRARVEELEAN